MSLPATSDAPRAPRAGRIVTAGIALLAAGAGVWKLRKFASPESVSPAVAADADAREAFLRTRVPPILGAAEAREMAAVQRAVAAVDARFSTYADGAPAFAASLTGWGMRFRILYRKGVETAEGKPDHSWTAALVQEKFAEHVVSDVRLEADIMEITKQLAYDLEASRNEMLASLAADLRASDLPVTIKSAALTDFNAAMNTRIRDLLAAMPVQSVAVGTGSLAAGIVAEEAVRQLIRVVIAQAAARLATGAIAAGGTTVAAATVGGTGGTAIAPGIGTAVGLAGGLVVGAVVDWWMTDEFEEKVTAQVREFLTASRTALVTGDRGLEALFRSEVQRYHAAAGRAVEGALRPPLP